MFLSKQNITHADELKITAKTNVISRCDALFKKETTHLDVQRTVTTYTTRYCYKIFLGTVDKFSRIIFPYVCTSDMR